MIPPDFIDLLLSRVDLVDVIERSVPLKRAGANLVACCPFHNEKTASFTVSPSKQFYHCFGCGAHGTALGFLMEYAGLGFVEAVKELAQSAGLSVPDAAPGSVRATKNEPNALAALLSAADYYRHCLKQAPQAIDYLKGRGVSGEIAARFRLGYAPPAWRNLDAAFDDYQAQVLVDAGLVVEGDGGRRYDRFRDRIMYPITNSRGQVIGFGARALGDELPKYLNSPETALFEKGRELYGLHQARMALRGERYALVVEGYMDVIALAQFGFANAVATLGTATSANHVSKLARQVDRIVFAFDGDAAGRKAAWRALEVSLGELPDGKEAAFLFLPAGEDPDSLVRHGGADALRALIAEARPLSGFLLDSLVAQCDLTQAEGRANLLHRARPLLTRVASPLLRDQLLRRLAELARVEVSELHRSIWPDGDSPLRRAPPPRRVRAAPPTLERQLLRLLLLKPDAVRVDLTLLEQDHAEAEAIAAIVALRDNAAGPRVDAVIFERLRDSPHADLVGQVQADNLADEFRDTEFTAELAGILRSLHRRPLQREATALRNKAANGRLNEAERARFAECLRLLNEFKGAVSPV
jgi:DNA primase